MRIGILGAGNVGGTLGRRWAELGHDVAFGVRRPGRGADAVKGGGALPSRARIASPADALKARMSFSWQHRGELPTTR